MRFKSELSSISTYTVVLTVTKELEIATLTDQILSRWEDLTECSEDIIHNTLKDPEDMNSLTEEIMVCMFEGQVIASLSLRHCDYPFSYIKVTYSEYVDGILNKQTLDTLLSPYHDSVTIYD